MNIFKFIEIKGARDRSYLCEVNSYFLILYFDTILQSNHPKLINLKNQKKLKELIENQFELKLKTSNHESSKANKDHLKIFSNSKYTAFSLKNNVFNNYDIALVVEKFPNLKILDFQNTKILNFQSNKEISNLPFTESQLKLPILDEIQLKVLSLSNINLNELPELIPLKKLTQLYLQMCTNLDNTFLLKEFSQLKKLHISEVNFLENFSFSGMSQLETLIIYNNNLKNIISFENLKKLKYLMFNNCQNFNPNFSLQAMPQLKSFIFYDSDPLPSLFSFADNNQLEELEISSYKRNPFPNLNSLKNLKKLELKECLSLIHFQYFTSMSQLKILVIDRTPFPSEPNFIGSLVHLENLQILGINVRKIPFLYSLINLKYLSVIDCKELIDFSFLSSAPYIESLAIEVFYPDQILHLTELRNLKNLEITDEYSSISNLSILEKENFKKLEKFRITGSSLESFDFLKKLKEMKILYFSHCKNRNNLSF